MENNENKEKKFRDKRIENTKRIASKSQKILDSNYDAFIDKVEKIFRNLNSKIDLLLNHSMIAKLVALIVAILLFISVNSSNDINIYGQNSVGKNLYGVNVKAIYDNNRYQIENLPQTVDLSLVGSIEGIRKTELIGSQEVIADLKNFRPGLNQPVQLLYSGVPQDVSVKFSQPIYYVNIFEKVEEDFLIESEFIRVPIYNKFKYSVELKTNIITISAAQHTLDRIASVRVLIDVSNKDEDFKQVASLAIFDDQGRIIEEITPPFSSVEVNVKVSKIKT